MKLKQVPDDFRVEELSTVHPSAEGRFRLYRLTKRGIGTIEAVAAICRRWNLAGRRLSYGGLKDRHAVTVQYLTILDGPDRPIRERGFELVPLGLVSRPYGPQHFSGNRFRIVLRDFGRRGAEQALAELDLAGRDGLPNYFDDQRFGSVGASGEFLAQAWLKGDYERALWLVLADPNASDRSEAKAARRVVQECWGRWAEAKSRLERSSTRSIVTYLVDHPADFRGAFARLNPTLRALAFSAFQSHLWNLILAGWMERTIEPARRVHVELKNGPLPFPRALEPEQRARLKATAIPLPSSRTSSPPEGELGAVAAEVLARFGLEWREMRIRHLKDVFFSKGTRPAVFDPVDLEARLEPDELHPGRFCLHLGFDLPKGSYATILVKRITEAGASPP